MDLNSGGETTVYLKNSSTRPLYRDAIRAGLLGLAINLFLGVSKLVGGIAGHSFALISDAVNSFGDVLTSTVVVCGLWFSQKPGDAEHPYGHTRADGVAATSVAIFVVLSALLVGWEAIRRVGLDHPLPPLWALWLAAGNVAIKEALYRYKTRVGRRTGSMSIIANAWDHRADALSSLAVFIGLSIVRWSTPHFMWADEMAALIVVALIMYSGIKLYCRSASELLDTQADETMLEAIRLAAVDVEGVEEVEKLWVRKTGIEHLADIHVEIDARLTIDEGHRIGHILKDRLMDEFPTLRDVLVHLEPYPNPHKRELE